MSRETYDRSLQDLESRRLIKRKHISGTRVEVVLNWRNKQYPRLAPKGVIEAVRDSFLSERDELAYLAFADQHNSLTPFLKLAKKQVGPSQMKEVVTKLTQLIVTEVNNYVTGLLFGPLHYYDYPEELMHAVYDEQIHKSTSMAYEWIKELAQFDLEATRLGDSVFPGWDKEHKIKKELSKLTGIEWAYVCVNCGTQWGTESDKRDNPSVCAKCD